MTTRVGRFLERLFDSNESELVLSVVQYGIQEFNLRLDELHDESTTISFWGHTMTGPTGGCHHVWTQQRSLP